MIRVAVVDDEELARRRIRELLDDEPDMEVVAEFGDPVLAAESLGTAEVDLLFVDIQMPECTGFDLIERVGVDAVPAVVFVTAHDQHALRAFEVHALDYLVKPFTRARFTEVVDRARRAAVDSASRERLRGELRSLLGAGGSSATRRIPIPSDGRVRFLPIEEIDWIEADGNYLKLHTASGSHSIRGTLRAMTERLPGDRFVRIHRSTIVRVEGIRELQPWSHGDYLVVLEDGRHLIATRTYADALKSALGY